MIEALTEVVNSLANPLTIGYIFLGIVTGLIFGVLPGLGGASAMAILLPFTYGLKPMVAMCFLASIMGAVPFGGSITSILLNTPGNAGNAATCLDGHPMARKGKARKALEISATATGFGSLFGVFVLILLLPVVGKIILLFGPPEFLVLFLFGLSAVALASKGNFLKGFIASGIGILLSLFGYSSVFGELRFTFGSEHLWDGFSLVPVLVGIFAVGEIINYFISGRNIAYVKTPIAGRPFDGVKETFQQKTNLIRSSIIGTIIGIIPGVGSATANFMAYIFAKRRSKHPETFGTGNPEGIVAAESANNSVIGGDLLPTLVFGIPGSVQMGVLLGAFVLHGLSPGPLFVKEQPEIVIALIFGLVISSLLASIFGLLTAHSLAKITRINVNYIVPIVLAFCFIGAYAFRENIWDVLVTVVFGFVGYGMVRHGYPQICLVIGFILGVFIETTFHQSLMMSYGSYLIFIERPVNLILIMLLLSAFIYPFMKNKIFTKKKNP